MMHSEPALDALRDIHLPAPPPFWPPAPGWWAIGALLLLGMTWLSLHTWRRWQRARRVAVVVRALREARRRHHDPVALLTEVSAVLRRVALQRFPREDVANLHGAAWLAFLDRTGGKGAFSSGAGAALADGPYRPTTACDCDAVLQLAEHWIEKNVP